MPKRKTVIVGDNADVLLKLTEKMPKLKEFMGSDENQILQIADIIGTIAGQDDEATRIIPVPLKVSEGVAKFIMDDLVGGPLDIVAESVPEDEVDRAQAAYAGKIGAYLSAIFMVGVMAVLAPDDVAANPYITDPKEKLASNLRINQMLGAYMEAQEKEGGQDES